MAAFAVMSIQANAQVLKKAFKFATFYTAVSGGNSLSDSEVFSVNNGLQTDVVRTPFDYSFTAGVRKIARFGYENRANAFYDGTEKSYSDAATIGKVKGFEFLFEGDYKRQQGVNYIDQNHFLRYVGKNWLTKVEYLQDGFADIKYYEASQRLRVNLGSKLSINLGVVQRISEPYGYNPLEEFILNENNSIHYTNLALSEGYSINPATNEYFNPEGGLVANSIDVWEEVIIPQVLRDYTNRKRSELPNQWNHSVVLGYDFYHFTKTFWIHSWGNILPYHLETEGDYSYYKLNENTQWTDYGGGLIFGKRFNKNIGVFLEGKYNKYWDRSWHDFSIGLNYIVL